MSKKDESIRMAWGLAALLLFAAGCSPLQWGIVLTSLGGGGGGGGGGNPADLKVELGPMSDPNSRANPGETGVEVLQILLTTGKNAVDVSSIQFEAFGSGDDSVAGLPNVHLWFDGDGDGQIGGGSDVQLGIPRQFSGDDGTVSFPISPVQTIPAKGSAHMLLVYDIAGAAPVFPGDDFCARITDKGQVQATVGTKPARVKVPKGGVSGCTRIRPVLVTVNPNTGNVAGGDPITIDTAGFDWLSETPVQVFFGALDASGTAAVVDADTITADSPMSLTSGPVDVFVQSSSGESALAPGAFTYVTGPLICDVTGVTPGVGPASGGDMVSIVGTGFEFSDPSLEVRFDGNLAANIVGMSPTQIDCETPPHAGPGQVTVEVSATNTFCSLPNAYLYTACTINSVTPTNGPIGMATSVTIDGLGFEPNPTAVLFGGVPATNVNVTVPDTITCDVPPDPLSMPAGGYAVDIELQNQSGSTCTLPSSYVYNPMTPDCVISQVVPPLGDVNGGQTVVVQGSQFEWMDPTLAVTFAGIPATNVVGIDATQVQCDVPMGLAAGPVEVIVSSTNTTCNLMNAFTYTACNISQVAPGNGPVNRSTTISITGSGGTGFEMNPIVLVGGVPATNVNRISSTQIDCDTPVDPGTDPTGYTVEVEVQNPSGSSCRINPGFTYDPAPPCVINSVSPRVGRLEGGDVVTIDGSNFDDLDPGLSVTFGPGNPGLISGVTPTQITVATPMSGAVGPVDVRVLGTYVDCTLPGGFEYDIIGVLDDDFGNAGIFLDDPLGGDDQGMSVTLDASERIIVVGGAANAGGFFEQAIWAIGKGGALDPTFDGDGFNSHNDAAGGSRDDIAEAVYIEPGFNEIFVGGMSINGLGDEDMVVWKYDAASGTLDGGFGWAGPGWTIEDSIIGQGNDQRAHGISSYNGDVYPAGYRMEGGGDLAMQAWGLNMIGDVLPFFGGGSGFIQEPGPGQQVIRDLRQIPPGSGEFYGGGRFQTFGAIWKYFDDGTLDLAWGPMGRILFDIAPGSDNRVRGLADDSFGRIIAGGWAIGGVAVTADAVVWRLTPAGMRDVTFGIAGVVIHDDAAGGGGDDEIRSVAVDAQGRIVAAGVSTAPGGDFDLTVWRFLDDGGLDPNFGAGLGYVTDDGDPGIPQSNEEVRDVVITSEGWIVVVGWTDGPGGNTDLIVWQFE